MCVRLATNLCTVLSGLKFHSIPLTEGDYLKRFNKTQAGSIGKSSFKSAEYNLFVDHAGTPISEADSTKTNFVLPHVS
jgi:hypothetical protein